MASVTKCAACGRPKVESRDDFRRILKAWLFDRAEQYKNSSGTRAAFDVLLDAVERDGQPFAAYDHGELDDVPGFAPREKP